MLTLTETAADVVKQLTENEAPSDAAGLRISAQTEGEDGPGLILAAAAAPEDGDEVLDEAGARVFLDESAAVMLDDRILDAQVSPDGAVQFAVGQQEA